MVILGSLPVSSNKPSPKTVCRIVMGWLGLVVGEWCYQR